MTDPAVPSDPRREHWHTDRDGVAHRVETLPVDALDRAGEHEPIPDPFVRRSQWRLWLDLVDKDVKGRATPAEAARLRLPEHLIDWNRALVALLHDVEGAITDSAARMRAHPGRTDAAGDVRAAYLVEKAEHDRRFASRARFLRGVKARQEEARFLLRQAHVDTHLTVGGLLGEFARIEEYLSRNDVEQALRIARGCLARARGAE